MRFADALELEIKAAKPRGRWKYKPGGGGKRRMNYDAPQSYETVRDDVQRRYAKDPTGDHYERVRNAYKPWNRSRNMQNRRHSWNVQDGG
jgi:hypothetical protein